MWEHEEMNVKELEQYLYLDSGTLTPVLKKMEQTLGDEKQIHGR